MHILSIYSSSSFTYISIHVYTWVYTFHMCFWYFIDAISCRLFIYDYSKYVISHLFLLTYLTWYFPWMSIHMTYRTSSHMSNIYIYTYMHMSSYCIDIHIYRTYIVSICTDMYRIHILCHLTYSIYEYISILIYHGYSITYTLGKT